MPARQLALVETRAGPDGNNNRHGIVILGVYSARYAMALAFAALLVILVPILPTRPR